MRHVDPRGRVGSRVEAGHVVAAVTVWDDGTDHLHLEIWRSLGGGYVFENMIDPFPVAWDPEPDPKPFYFEDAPRPGRRRAGARLAWPQPERGGAARAERASRDLGRTVTTVKDDEGVFHVLWWAGSAPAAEYRFGGWALAATRDVKRKALESSTGRRCARSGPRHEPLTPGPPARWPEPP